ncbi:hypothetical protein AMTR_s00032p00222110 [Amborella trichopoda]|uniref:Cytochrome P450 n=1 Tax=Amborella trichopoda TaxID=13333 RepID=U5D3P3_AMBTC|nr:hypothetical protein AMTR_s00032p00222110 [Amborella trichopoda]
MDWVSVAWVMSMLICVHTIIVRACSFTTRKLPPGPKGLPLVGSLLEFGNRPHEALATLAKTHGPLMTLRLGLQTMVVVSSSDMAKEVYQKNDHALAGRFIPLALKVESHDQNTLVWAQIGPQWRNFRRFCTTQLFTKQRLKSQEVLRHQKVRQMVGLIEKDSAAKRAVAIRRVALLTALNLLWNIIFSIDMVDPEPFDPQGIQRQAAGCIKKFHQIFNDKIEERLRSRESGCPRCGDFLDSLLDPIDEKGSKFSRAEILALILELNLAGASTAAVVVEWAMAELLQNPEKMATVKQELSKTVGYERPVEEADMDRLPYLQAVIKETLRFHPPGPLFLPHRANATVEVAGFIIPKNTTVVINYWAISREACTWENPTTFSPERFMGSDINYKGRDFSFIPFGGGRRICPGLPLGERMVQLLLASLLHSFEWELPLGCKPEEMDMSDKLGLALHKKVPLEAIPMKKN